MAFAGRIDLLRGCEIFLALADTGSTTEASRLLRITQSAVSQQLKHLEAELGTVLIDRRRRPLRLTPSGISLRHHAVQLLTQADRLRAEGRHIASNRVPHLRIAMFSTLAKTLAPAILDAVVSRRLRIETVSILRGMAQYQGRELVDREVDVAITSNPLYDVEGMERHELLQEQFMVLLPRAANTRRLSLRDLAQRLPLIRYSNRTEAGRLIERHLRRQRIAIPHTFSFDAPEEMFAMVAMGRGFAITAPTHVAHALDASAHVALRALPGPSLSRGITLVSRVDELGKLPAQLAKLCRQVLTQDYLPGVHKLVPMLADHLTIVEGADQSL
jgi:DNA-binding transcriptional LysR family regulator